MNNNPGTTITEVYINRKKAEFTTPNFFASWNAVRNFLKQTGKNSVSTRLILRHIRPLASVPLF